MRILALSDTHGNLPAIDVSAVDCVMIAGDICPPGVHISEVQKPWLESAFASWVENLGKPVYLALGNHDFCDNFACPPNLHYGTETVIDQVLIFSWTLRFADYAWEEDEDIMEMKLEALLASRPTPPVWLTHGPPWGVCDGRKGSNAMRRAIENYQPEAVICGHIHEGRGTDKLGNTKIYNVSVLSGLAVWIGKPPAMDWGAVLIEI